ncbi:MAG: helix-turn-helix transcriptional regulator [Clostridia bacterium]|nr:helix-turn-helix transcriptional regulator [Clostridia bacterium]
MEIRSICVCDHVTGGFTHSSVSAETEEKTLPMLSVVQSIRGSYRISVDGSPEVETGDMGVFIAPRQVSQRIFHIPSTDGTMDAHWVFLDVEINRLYKLDDLYAFPVLLPPAYNNEIYDLLRQIAHEERLLRKLPALHRIVEILLENAMPKSQVSEEIIRLRSYVENHYMQTITPDDLSRVLHCSRSAMYRRFNEYFGESPSHYVNRVRIRHAQLLLSSTNRSISDIAAAVGIPDIYYFSRLFHTITGETAGAYRSRTLLPSKNK